MSKVRTLVVWKTDKNLGFDIPEEIQVTWAHPEFWNGVPRPIHDAVYAPDHPEIERVHEEHGKVIWRPDETVEEKGDVQNDERVVVGDVPDVDSSHKVETVANEEVDQEKVEEINLENYKDFSWPKMRSLATKYSEEPVKSKAQAIEILENEASKRNG